MPAERSRYSGPSTSPSTTSDRLQRFKFHPALTIVDDPTNRTSTPFFVDSESDHTPPKPGPPKASRIKQEPRRGSSSNGTRKRNSLPPTAPDTEEQSKDAIRIKLSKLDNEIKSVEDQLVPLQQLHATLKAERRSLESQLHADASLASSSYHSSASTKPFAHGQRDYQASSFPWSPAIRSTLKSTFGLDAFRLCQEGVINAAMDCRDIVCVMPTGGGKSLTYQLPAITGKGITIVISPLLALIWDQVRALKELGIESVMLTGSTSTAEQNEIYRRIEGTSQGKELKLVYLTPEKVSKSKRLMAALEKANARGYLKRFVIDEAHCCSQLGHDFRPDYRKLSTLKTLFPRVPIQAVTATLSSKTMPDLLKILRMAPITDGRAANSHGTVFFSAPLFRPNLHYRVISKPSSAKSAVERMGMWINDNHPGKSGIVYCLSKKDAETVAESLREWSGGAIKTGVYHAGVDEYHKQEIHLDWRTGRVNCICATIAFGLGIDKGDVRYVIHHSMSKSLEGYYQETGRAGRDGQDSDCVLFYRGQDAARLSSMVYSDVDGSAKLQEMLRFAHDLKTCRKVAFAKYFSNSTQLSAAAWDNPDALAASGGKITTCGICDNCTREPGSIATKDVTLDAWKVLTVLNEVVGSGGRVTLANLVGLVRGLNAGTFAVPAGGGKRKRAEPEKAHLKLDELIGKKISMSSDDTEALLVQMSLTGYLDNSYSATAHSVNVYVIPGIKATRLTRLTLEKIEGGDLGFSIECTFPSSEVKPKKARKQAEKKVVDIDVVDAETDTENPSDPTATSISKADSKRKTQVKKEQGCDKATAKVRSKKRKTADEPSDNEPHEPSDGGGDPNGYDEYDEDDEYEDLLDLELHGWDEEDVAPLNGGDIQRGIGFSPVPHHSDEEDDASSDRENGWKVINGSKAGRAAQGASKRNAIVLSD